MPKIKIPSLCTLPFPSGKRPRTNQGQTKDEPKNAQIEKVRFINVDVRGARDDALRGALALWWWLVYRFWQKLFG